MTDGASVIDRCARLIEENIIMDTSAGKVLAPRQDGNRDGLHYATAIRALSTTKPAQGDGESGVDRLAVPDKRNPEPCGGCGETNPSHRCIGCLHSFFPS